MKRVFLWAFLFGLAGSLWASPKGEFYYQLAGYWSPIIYQDTWFMPEGDYLTRFDGDGDWVGNNNLDNFLKGKFRPYPAYLYYTVMESKTHYFIIYGFFHPVDYDHPLRRIIPGTTHENDMEGMMVVVQKVEDNPMGRFRLFETWAHNWWNIYSSKEGLKPRKVWRVEKAYLEGSHPLIYIQRGGHGPYGLYSWKSAYKYRGDFKGHKGVIYRFKGRAEAPEGSNDREVGYDLIPFDAPGGIWERRCDLSTFDAEPLVYQPPPSRPSLKSNPEGCPFKDQQVPRAFDGDLSGFANRPDAANCFWGWGKSLPGAGKSKGIWAFDPAWAINWQFKFKEEFSLEYIYNPFLDLGENG